MPMNDGLPPPDPSALFAALLPPSASWRSVVCPFCSDAVKKEKKGGYLFGSDGGFTYKCWKAGCDYVVPTGWGEGFPASSRLMAVYGRFGGDPQDMREWNRHFYRSRHRKEPLLEKDAHGRIRLNAKAVEPSLAPRLPVKRAFERMDVPNGWRELRESSNPQARRVADALRHDAHRRICYWDSKRPNDAILPYWNRQGNSTALVGFLSKRALGDSGNAFHDAKPSPNFMFGQDILWEEGDHWIFVVESPFDAALLPNAVAVHQSSVSESQVAAFKESGKKLVFMPDLGDEDRFKQCADRLMQRYYKPLPPFKDLGDMIAAKGAVGAVRMVMERFGGLE